MDREIGPKTHIIMRIWNFGYFSNNLEAFLILFQGSVFPVPKTISIEKPWRVYYKIGDRMWQRKNIISKKQQLFNFYSPLCYFCPIVCVAILNWGECVHDLYLVWLFAQGCICPSESLIGARVRRTLNSKKTITPQYSIFILVLIILIVDFPPFLAIFKPVSIIPNWISYV